MYFVDVTHKCKMNKETLTICKHEIDKLMREYQAANGLPRTVNQLLDQNARAIFLLAEVVRQLLEDKE
jgi:hypothetical protein